MASCRLAGHRPFGALAARNRIGGQNFAARQPCNVRPAARAFWRNWPINTVHVGNRSRWGAFACGLRFASARSRCIGNVARWATDLGADAVQFAPGTSAGSASVSVRLRLRSGSHSVSLRFAFGSVPRYLGQVSVRSLAARNRPGCHRCGCGARRPISPQKALASP
jgi:hypothetical protein